MTHLAEALLERPHVDLKIRLHHRKHAEVTDAIQRVLAADDGGGPIIVPLLGPTRCGKSQILQELSLSRGRMVSGPGSLLAGADFRIGAIPPRPSERDIYKALLQACEYHCPDRERTDAVRRRAFRALLDQGVRFIALDECNHLAEPGANVPHRAAGDHFKSIVDETGVGLILTGLPKFQSIIDNNEQFRDRCHATVQYLPYDWHVEADRSEFYGAVLTILERFKAAGSRLDLDEIDCTRRLYGATGGRVGMVVWLMEGAAAALGDRPALTMEIISTAALRRLQKRTAVDFFTPEAPDDCDLFRAHVDIMTEAELRVFPRGGRDLGTLT